MFARSVYVSASGFDLISGTAEELQEVKQRNVGRIDTDSALTTSTTSTTAADALYRIVTL
eukprot:gene29818-30651_t